MKAKRILSVMLSVVMIVGAAIPVAAEPGPAEKSVEIEKQPIVENGITGGYIPSDLDYNTPVYEPDDAVPYFDDWEYSEDETLESKYPANGVSDIEAKYPAARDQNPYGTCWAFSSIGLGEFDLINDGSFNKDIDLSELQLAYFVFNSVTDPLGGTAGDYCKYYNENASNNYLNYGGNYEWSMNRLMQWSGVVNETTMPYYNAGSVLKSGMDSKYAYDYDVAQLRSAYMINIKKQPEAVKRAIKEHGAVGVNYTHYSSAMKNLYNAPKSYYDYEGIKAGFGDGGHAVMIVGWDDNFSKDNFNNKPQNDGAWLVRNSWGNYFDYFWMSYDTQSLTDTAYVFDFSADKYDNNYQLDGGIYTQKNTYYKGAANVYTVPVKDGVESETLKAVSVSFMHEADVSYTIDIYTDLTDKDNPLSGNKVDTITGTTSYAGVYTINLNNKNVKLKPGSSYSVVVNTGDKIALDWEYAIQIANKNINVWDCKVSAGNGKSFYNNGAGKYVKYYSAKYPESYKNFCIKAFTINNAVTESLGETVFGRSLTLKDNIDVNYYMELTDSIVNSNNAYMEFELDNGKKYQIKVTDAVKVNKDNRELYKFSCPLNATQMSDIIKARLVVNGQSGTEYNYSIRQYASQVLFEEKNVSNETVAMVKALLNYGASAQTFFNYNTGNLANSILQDDDKKIKVNNFEEFKATETNKNNDDGLKYYGSSLICESEMTLRHYYKLSEGHRIDEYQFSYTDSAGKEKTLYPKQYTKDKTLYYVDISGIMAYNLNMKPICKVNKNNACISELTYGPFSYAHKVAISSTTTNSLKNLTNALYTYWESVDSYVKASKLKEVGK